MRKDREMNAVATQRENRQVAEGRSEDHRYEPAEVDIFENKEGYVLLADMPGVKKDGLELTLEGNTLTIVGHRAAEELKGNAVYRESRPVHYRRVFELDPAIDAAHIRASVDQGVLTLEMPKAERVKPRKISVS